MRTLLLNLAKVYYCLIPIPDPSVHLPFSCWNAETVQLWMQESMWRSTRLTSSMCTGVYTAEMSLAAAVDIINRSKVLDFRVDIRCAAVWDWALENNKQTMATQGWFNCILFNAPPRYPVNPSESVLTLSLLQKFPIQLIDTLPGFTGSNFKCSTMPHRVAHSQSVVRSSLSTPLNCGSYSCQNPVKIHSTYH